MQEVWKKECLKNPSSSGWFWEFVEWISNFKYKEDEIPDEIFDSMEQLWLAFCQKRLHNKVWDDEKEVWIRL